MIVYGNRLFPGDFLEVPPLVKRWSMLPLWLRLSAIAVGCGAALLAVEEWAQGQRPQLPGWGGPQGTAGLMVSHPTRLWGMSPGTKPNAEGSETAINALGFRGAEPEMPKPSGRSRIVSLGDSAFFGFGVNDGETFDAHLVRSLQAEGIDVDSMNAGVAGYSIAQHRVAMDEEIWDLEPDLLVLCNVWSDNTWDTFKDEDLLVSARFAQRNPLTRSAALKLFAAWWAGVFGGNDGRIIVWSGAEGWPEGKVRRVPLDRWIQLHHEVLLGAAERGISVVFLKPTNSFLLDPESSGAPPAWIPYFEAMDALAAHHEIPVVDVTEAYLAAIENGAAITDLLWDKMHPTAQGHAVLGDALKHALLVREWPLGSMVPTTGSLPNLGVQDIPNPEWTDDAGAGSPQISLFELTEQEKSAMMRARKSLEAQGPPILPDAQSTETARGPSVRTAPQSSTWSVAISLEEGQAPYTVRLVDEEGRTVGSARVKKAQSFRLKVRQDVRTVRVEVTDSMGRTKTQQASPSADAVTLRLGG